MGNIHFKTKDDLSKFWLSNHKHFDFKGTVIVISSYPPSTRIFALKGHVNFIYSLLKTIVQFKLTLVQTDKSKRPIRKPWDQI